MQRRKFIMLIGAAAATQVAPSRSARAQVSTKRLLLAVLAGVTQQEFPTSFMQGIRTLGYVEGSNIDVA